MNIKSINIREQISKSSYRNERESKRAHRQDPDKMFHSIATKKQNPKTFFKTIKLNNFNRFKRTPLILIQLIWV